MLRGTALPPTHWPEPWLTLPPVVLGSCGNTYRHSSADNAFPSFDEVAFQNLTVVDSVARQWLSVTDWNPNATALAWGNIIDRGVTVVNPHDCWVHVRGVNATVPLRVQCKHDGVNTSSSSSSSD